MDDLIIIKEKATTIHTTNSLELQAFWSLDNEHGDLDISCLLFGKSGVLIDAAYFKRLVVEGDAIVHHGDVKKDVEGVDESITLNIGMLNPGVKALALVITCYGPSSLNTIQSLNIRFEDRTNNICYTITDTHLQVSPDSEQRAITQKSYVVGFLFRPSDRNLEEWQLLSIQKPIPYTNFLDSVPELRQLLTHYDIIDPALLSETKEVDKKGFDLVKGEYFDLPDTHKLQVGLGWDAGCDLDSSIAFYDQRGLMVSPCVYYGNKAASGVTHNGDNVTGVGEGDDETIDIDLNKLPSGTHTLYVLINVYSQNKTFGEVRNAYVRLSNMSGRRNEICKYMLTSDNVDPQATAYVMCKIFRYKGADLIQRWRVLALGVSAGGNTCITTTQQLTHPISIDSIRAARINMQISVTEGRNLVAKDSNGFSDPYFLIYIDDKKYFKSEVMKKTLNPKWAKQLEPIDFAVYDTGATRLDYLVTIEVWDKDLLSDDFMGRVQIPVSIDLNNRTFVDEETWHPLSKRKQSEKVSGDINLTIRASMLDVELSVQNINAITL